MSVNISLVTGGAGFIGGHIVRQLADRGSHVRVLDLAAKPDYFPEDIEYVQGSIFDSNLLHEVLEGVGDVYHLAGNPHLWASDPSVFDEINYVGTQKVLDATRSARIRKLVFTSTESILRGYRNASQTIINETSPFPALEEMPGPYTRSKYQADQTALQAAKEGLPVVIVHPTGPIGPDDPHLTAPNQMIRDFLDRKAPAFLECMLNFAHVSDIAEGHILAAQKGKIGERYILGNENLYLSEILNMLQELFDIPVPRRKIPYWIAELTGRSSGWIAGITQRKPIASLEGVRLAKAHLAFDCTKARTELGMPQTPVRQAILETGKWLMNQGYVKKIHQQA